MNSTDMFLSMAKPMLSKIKLNIDKFGCDNQIAIRIEDQSEENVKVIAAVVKKLPLEVSLDVLLSELEKLS